LSRSICDGPWKSSAPRNTRANSSGTLANTYTYDSFGNLTTSTGTVSNPFQFTGREFDPETGLYYYRARYYDPTTGRFLSEDPLEFGGELNFYRYAQNNPVLLIDPLGLSSLVFNRAKGTLTLLDKNGHVVIVCDAGNNTTKHSKGPLAEWDLPILKTQHSSPRSERSVRLTWNFHFQSSRPIWHGRAFGTDQFWRN
jgi:RHS repeat-associated protein